MNVEPVELLSIAYSSRRGSGESYADHAATREQVELGAEGRTLCGRKLGRMWFWRQQRWTGGQYNFECRQCVRATPEEWWSPNAVRHGL